MSIFVAVPGLSLTLAVKETVTHVDFHSESQAWQRSWRFTSMATVKKVDFHSESQAWQRSWGFTSMATVKNVYFASILGSIPGQTSGAKCLGCPSNVLTSFERPETWRR